MQLIMTYNNITDQDIQALIDSELDWETEKKVRQAISKDTVYQNRYHLLKSQKTLLQTWWKQKSH